MRAAYLVIILGLLLLPGCAGVERPEKRAQGADFLARAAGFSRQIVPGRDFDLTIYSRIAAPGKSARVYIEGDGLAWMGRRMPSGDPTPTDPVALRLAVADPAENVIYMARPCQYSRGARCQRDYWTHKRFAPEAVRAVDEALDRIVAAAPVDGVELVGFSGGGTMGALLAARRGDVVSLRSVAGNLDHRAHSRVHNVSLLDGSLNPPDEAARLRDVPQLHFIGAQDKNVTAEIYQSYRRALRDGRCVRHEMVAGVAHEKGWVEKWPELLNRPVLCE